MIKSQKSLTYHTPKNRGGLAIFGKTRTTTGFSRCRKTLFQTEPTENSPNKNEVSDLGVLNPCPD